MNDRLKQLFLDLYIGRFIQTLWNAEDQVNRDNGWELKSKLKVPWFFNMRPVGDEPLTFNAICREMAVMIDTRRYGSLTNNLLAVEMAGVPLVGGVSNELAHLGRPIRFAYTRPLKQKVRKPAELLAVLQQTNVDGYGQKDLIEGRIRDGDIFAVFDDMTTTLDSKIIARGILLWLAEQRGLDITCDTIFYFLDRGKDSKQVGKNYASYEIKELWPASLDVNFVIPFDQYLPVLEDAMTGNEYQAIQDHQKDPNRFGEDAEWRESLLAMAKKEAH